jgi:hypothetical protein
MNSQPGKLSVLPGRVKTAGVTPVVYDESLLRGCKVAVLLRINDQHLLFPCADGAPFGSDAASVTPFCKAVSLAEWKEARPV